MPASTTPPIDIRNVWKVFGPRPDGVIDALDAGASKDDVLGATGHVVAVRDISFQVQPGETFVVMGLSGSGKSTLLRLLPRLIEPTRGSIRIDGEDIAGFNAGALRELRRHRMSMVFQHFGLLPHRTILENVAYGLEVQGIKKADRLSKAKSMLDIVNLHGWEQHYPNQLSGGMQQRVGLARALAVDPEIMLFDEPFSALDPLIRREMQDELVRLQARMQKTIVFITHDFAEAIKLGTHIAIMKDGVFDQVGSPEEIVLYPATDYVAEFTRDVPKMRVLSARSVMQPLAGSNGEFASTVNYAQSPIVSTTRLDACAAQVLSSDEPCPVVDADGRHIGAITRSAILNILQADGDGSRQIALATTS